MTEHYWTGTASPKTGEHLVRCRFAGRDWEFVSSGGVFSATRLDPGTAVLLRMADAPASGTLLDLGCGYGPIAVSLAARVPDAEVWGVDVNERALELARRNAAAYGVADRTHLVLPDAVPDTVTFDEIWSNPPIRIGKSALYALLDRWLPRLAPDGCAYLVVNRNLGADSLHRRLVEQGYDVERCGSSNGFRVLRVAR